MLLRLSPSGIYPSLSSPDKMKLSVVIATYRRASSLSRTLATISAQCRLPDEVIVVDQSPAEEKVAVEAVVQKAARLLKLLLASRPAAKDACMLDAGVHALIAEQCTDDRSWEPSQDLSATPF